MEKYKPLNRDFISLGWKLYLLGYKYDIPNYRIDTSMIQNDPKDANDPKSPK